MGEESQSNQTRLEWVARNRKRESSVVSIGSTMAGLVERMERETLPVEEVAARVGEIVDDEFRDLCRIEGIEQGVLRIGVAEANATASLTRKWTGRLREALPAKLKIKRIAFAYGTRGYRID
jgi:hypothetical protein